MADIAPVVAAYTTEIAKISDTLINAKATYQLARWSEAQANQTSLEANEIQSYTVGDRTFTRRDVAAGQSALQQMENDLNAMIYGTAYLADNNQIVSQPLDI
jgi:hypothetical protein